MVNLHSVLSTTLSESDANDSFFIAVVWLASGAKKKSCGVAGSLMGASPLATITATITQVPVVHQSLQVERARLGEQATSYCCLMDS